MSNVSNYTSRCHVYKFASFVMIEAFAGPDSEGNGEHSRGDTRDGVFCKSPFRGNGKCYLCKKSENVMLWESKYRCFSKFTSSTYSTNVIIKNRVFARTVEVCHRCIEVPNGKSQGCKDTLADKFVIESSILGSLYEAELGSLPFDELVVDRILEYLFKEKHEYYNDESDVEITPALVASSWEDMDSDDNGADLLLMEHVD